MEPPSNSPDHPPPPAAPAEASSTGAEPTKRRFVGRRKPQDPSTALARTSGAGRRVVSAIPAELLEHPELNAAVAQLPSNYGFELHKTIWRIKQAGATSVALQFPEGLLIFACTISDILERFAGVSTLIMGDVTYGACCVDDFSAKALGCDFMVHYGHSCLVPTDVTEIPTLYVFVTIAFDPQHLIDTIAANFEPSQHLCVMGTIQFAASFPAVRSALGKHGYSTVSIPQAKPLSPGEVLGCTAPKLPDGSDILVFVCDGRFHLEAVMIANPDVPAFKYDPYSQILTSEGYDHAQMLSTRHTAASTAHDISLAPGSTFGIVLGTLGRQGAPHILAHLEDLLTERNLKYFVVLLSEIFPDKLKIFGEQADAWVQIACPRLSIDWGYAFHKPLLSPYEAVVALTGMEGWQETYPMDFYKKESGPWSASTLKFRQQRNSTQSQQVQ